MTLSKEQKALADERIKAAGLEDKIRVHLMDYRDLPPHFEKAFDAFVSIEMVEVSSCSFLYKCIGTNTGSLSARWLEGESTYVHSIAKAKLTYYPSKSITHLISARLTGP